MLNPLALLPRDALIAILVGCLVVTLIATIVGGQDP